MAYKADGDPPMSAQMRSTRSDIRLVCLRARCLSMPNNKNVMILIMMMYNIIIWLSVGKYDIGLITYAMFFSILLCELYELISDMVWVWDIMKYNTHII